MGSLKRIYILGLIAITVILLTAIKIFHLGPSEWPATAVIFLSLCELANILITDRKRNTISPQQSVNLLLGLKVGKILLSSCFLLIYWILVKAEIKRFLLIFSIFYLIYLVFDTFYLMSLEKEAKKKKLLTEV